MHPFCTVRDWGFDFVDADADTWPSQLDIAHAGVMEQWLFSVFSIVSGMIGLGYGSYPPVTWGEALLSVFAMLVSHQPRWFKTAEL